MRDEVGLGVDSARVPAAVHFCLCTHMHICGSGKWSSGCAHQMIQHFMDRIHVL